jgi:hypothetical protein
MSADAQPEDGESVPSSEDDLPSNSPALPPEDGDNRQASNRRSSKAKPKKKEGDEKRPGSNGWLRTTFNWIIEKLPSARLVCMIIAAAIAIGFGDKYGGHRWWAFGVVMVIASLPAILAVEIGHSRAKSSKTAKTGRFDHYGFGGVVFYYAGIAMTIVAIALIICYMASGWPPHLGRFIEPDQVVKREPVGDGIVTPTVVKFGNALEVPAGDAHATTRQWLPWLRDGIIKSGNIREALLVIESIASPTNYVRFSASVEFARNKRFELVEGCAFVVSLPDKDTGISSYNPIPFSIVYPDTTNQNTLDIPPMNAGEKFLIIVRVRTRALKDPAPDQLDDYGVIVRSHTSTVRNQE